jgi:hypothetical protein
MKTCENLADRDLLTVLTSSAADSHAKTLALPEVAQGLLESAAGYGRKLPDLFTSYDPPSSSWKTSQLCLVAGLTEFSETWPRSGLMRSGIAYRLPSLAYLTRETGCGLLPTVTVCGNYNRVGASATSGDGVATVVKRLTGFFPAAEFCEVMMGFPPRWTELVKPETP